MLAEECDTILERCGRDTHPHRQEGLGQADCESLHDRYLCSHNVDTGASALAGLLLEAPVWRVMW